MTWDKLHDEDVLYEFRGTSADELTSDRFYQGRVDGFAEFGVFVTLNESVTGLLHRSKLTRRLESLDWDAGDEVIVKVEGVRDNGNVDLDWSIRQSPEEFRGKGIDDPTVEAEQTADSTPPSPQPVPEPDPERSGTADPDRDQVSRSSAGSGQVIEAVALAQINELSGLTGERVRLEGRIADVRQTSGPTVFTLEDEGGQVECAAFESAGVRAYPEIETDDVVRVVGVVEHHRGEIQIETDSIEPLDADERSDVLESIAAAARERAAPADPRPLTDDPALADLVESMVEIATRLRKAALASRVIVIRHPPTVDGVVGGAAIEHALAAVIDEEHPGSGGDGRTVRRRPMRDQWYDLGDAMYDLGADPEGESPVVMLVGAGTTDRDQDALEFLDLYDAERLVIDASVSLEPMSTVTDAAAISDGSRTAATVATHVAGMVAESVRDELAPLPAIGVRGAAPEVYQSLADDYGIDANTSTERYQALALIAYHQRYDDKRQLVADLLFDGDEAGRLAGHISAQYRDRVDTAVKTARENWERSTRGTTTIGILDADKHAHRFDFPPTSILAEELLDAEEVDAVLVLGTDECHIAAASSISLAELADAVAEQVPQSAVASGRDRLTFLAGTRDAVQSALIDELVE